MVISVVSTRKLIIKGADAYFTYIIDLAESTKDIGQVQVVKRILDVFPGELPRMLGQLQECLKEKWNFQLNWNLLLHLSLVLFTE